MVDRSPIFAELPLRSGNPLSAREFADLRRAAVLEHCKWDPQVGDQATLAPFPVLMGGRDWRTVARLAESLAAETLLAERELSLRNELHAVLGLPAALRKALSRVARHGTSPGIARSLRFDFHFTSEGWRISEVNSDVPGGFAEAEGFTSLMARSFPTLHSAGTPGSDWADAMVIALSAAQGPVALLSAPGYLEDAQVVAYLAKRLEQRGLPTRLLGPAQLEWRAGRAYLAGSDQRLRAVVRFFQLEWLARYPAGTGWDHFVTGGTTPVSNSALAAFSESKRLPLTWSELATPLPTWRRLLPETREPRSIARRSRDEWVLKGTFSNGGDAVIARPWVGAARWHAAWARAWLEPASWVAQRRFHVLSMDSPIGRVTPCLGVYVVEGRVAGAYLRLSRAEVTDYTAVDAALLIADD